MDIIFIVPDPPLPGGHDGGTKVVYWVLRYLHDRGHTIRVIYLENPDFYGKPYSDQDRDRDRWALQDIGVTEVRSIAIPASLRPEILNAVGAPPAGGLITRLRRSLAYRLARARTVSARRAHIARNIKTISDDMQGDVCFSFFELLTDIQIKPTKPLVSWMFQTGEPIIKLYIEFGFRKVLGSQSLARLLCPLMLAFHHRHLRRACKNADHMIMPIHFYAEIWRRIMAGRSEIHFFPHPAEDESGDLTCADPTRPPDTKPFRIVLYGHLRAALTTAGLVHFTDHILPALERRGRLDEFEFEIVGKFEPYPFVATKLQRPNIHFSGYIENFAETLNDAHAVLVPIPLPPGPGMRLSSACAVSACIVTHRATATGSPEFVDGENCLMATNGEEFTDALIRVCEDRNLNRQLRTGARATYDQNYRMEDCGRAVEKILREA